MKRYSVHKINKPLSDNSWENAILLKDFSYPWRNEIPKETSFKALYDADYLYIQFDVKDTDIHIYQKDGNKREVAQSDRVELFFRKDENLNPYYCLEIDPNGRILDYSARYYRKLEFEWGWPQGHLFVTTHLIPEGYCVNIKISLESLRKLGLLTKNEIQTGIFRANCVALPIENEKEATIKWISWVDPETESPDFHVPTSFGILELIDF